MKNKKTVLALIFVCVIGLVGGTIAYFSSTDIFENIFNSSVYKMEVYEVFESPVDWLPGDTTPKNVVATNKGNVDAAVRVSFQEVWEDGNGNTISLTDANGNKASIIDFTKNNKSKWIQHEDNGVTYYYYKIKLGQNESTPSLIDSVTFNPLINGDNDHNCVTDDETHTTTCSSDMGGYSGGHYKLTIKVETVQYDKYKEIWGTNVEILNEFVKPYTIVSGDLDTVGSIVKIADEEFYVIGQEDASHVKLLAKYNLGVGNGFETPTNRQDATATGFVSGGSSPYPGSVAFSSTNYWNENVSTYPSYIYNSNSIIYQYVEDYVTYLNSLGPAVTGRLISKEEIESIINNGNNLPYGNFSSTASNIAGKEWIYSTSYWSGSAHDSSYIWHVGSSGYLHDVKYSSGRSYGIRPVIILEIPSE